MNIDKLKKCPFCGCGQIDYGYREENMSSRYGEEIHYFECSYCGAKMEVSNSPYTSGELTKSNAIKELIKLWNERV